MAHVCKKCAEKKNSVALMDMFKDSSNVKQDICDTCINLADCVDDSMLNKAKEEPKQESKPRTLFEAVGLSEEEEKYLKERGREVIKKYITGKRGDKGDIINGLVQVLKDNPNNLKTMVVTTWVFCEFCHEHVFSIDNDTMKKILGLVKRMGIDKEV